MEVKVKVIRPFRDKYTNVVYMEGQKIEVSRERCEEINSTALGPFVKVEGAPKPKPKKKAKKQGD